MPTLKHPFPPASSIAPSSYRTLTAEGVHLPLCRRQPRFNRVGQRKQVRRAADDSLANIPQRRDDDSHAHNRRSDQYSPTSVGRSLSMARKRAAQAVILVRRASANVVLQHDAIASLARTQMFQRLVDTQHRELLDDGGDAMSRTE